MGSNDIYFLNIPGLGIFNERFQTDFAYLNVYSYEGAENEGEYPQKITKTRSSYKGLMKKGDTTTYYCISGGKD